MIRDEAVAFIKRRLGFRRDLTDEIIQELIAAQTSLEQEPDPPWFLLGDMQETDAVAGEERIRLPVAFLAEWEEGTLWRYDPTALLADPWIELKKDYYDVLKAHFIRPGPPVFYANEGNYFTLHPTPDAPYRMRMRYYQRAPTLTTNIENVWLKEAWEWLVGEAGISLAASVQGPTDIFVLHRDKGKKSVRYRGIDRELKNLPITFGGSQA